MSRDTLNLMHSVVAREEYRRLLELMLKSQRATELTLKEKIDLLQSQLKTETERNAALDLLQRDSLRRSQLSVHRTLDEKLIDMKKVYEIKAKTLGNENHRLLQRLKQIEDEMDAVEIQEMKDNSFNLEAGMQPPSEKQYSDINSLIESISMDGIQSIMSNESDEF